MKYLLVLRGGPILLTVHRSQPNAAKCKWIKDNLLHTENEDYSQKPFHQLRVDGHTKKHMVCQIYFAFFFNAL